MSRAKLETAIRSKDYATALKLSRALYNPARADADIGAMHGHVLQQQGLHDEARAVLEVTARSRPLLPSVWIDLANACIAQSDWPAATQALTQFRQLAPHAGAGLFAEAQIHCGLGDLERAEKSFAAAARIHPAWIERRFGLGNQAFDREQFAQASAHYRACVNWRADWLEARRNLISSLTLAEQFAPALAVTRDSARQFPNDIKLLQRYSQLLDLVPNSDARERLDVRSRWLSLAPDSPSAHLDLANALIANGDNERAHEHYAAATALAPEQLQARWTALHLPRHSIFDSTAEIDAFAEQWRSELAFFESRTEDPDSATCLRMIATCANFWLAYAGTDLRTEYERHGHLLRRYCDHALTPRPLAVATRIVNTRRRIGVVSAHFRRHSVSRVWRDLIVNTDPDQIELICFDLDGEEDESVAIWRRRAAEYINTRRDVLGWHQALIAHPVDVLIFLDLGMHPISQALATQRHAPVQCTTSGHPMTSGLPNIDYFLSSDLAEVDAADDHYSEQLVRLPGLAWAYQATAKKVDAPPTGLFSTRTGIGYYCAQNGVKLLPTHDLLFARILAQTSGSMLALTPSLRANAEQRLKARMQRQMDAAGIDASTRVQYFGTLNYDSYISLLERSDVLLDTQLFSGGLTSMDALSRDIPIVTLPGQLLRSRQTMAMLKLLELDELIARDEDDYVRIAVRLGNDDAWRNEIRSRIRERKHRLYEYQPAREALQTFLCDVQPRAVDHS